VTVEYWNRAPNRCAWDFMFMISIGPSIPSTNPGKFSTNVVVESWPPGSRPSSTSGSKLARPA